MYRIDTTQIEHFLNWLVSFET